MYVKYGKVYFHMEHSKVYFHMKHSKTNLIILLVYLSISGHSIKYGKIDHSTGLTMVLSTFYYTSDSEAFK